MLPRSYLMRYTALITREYSKHNTPKLLLSYHRYLALLLVSGIVCCARITAARRPDVGTVCCPNTKAYLPSPRATAALMTFPGSGNTWVRHIIETLTGYHTSSVYCDKFLQPVFKAECDDSHMWDSSIAVKTHKFSCWWKRSIVIIRHPLRAIMGDYQRLRTGRSHTGIVEPQRWNWNDWYAVSTRQCHRWTVQFQRIFGNAEQDGCGNATDFKVFFYEDLKTATGALNPYFLDELLDWFGIPKEDSFYDCALMNNKGQFARKLPQDHPATRILNDAETFRRMSEAGCLQAYDFYRQKFPGLRQPGGQPNAATAISTSSSTGSSRTIPFVPVKAADPAASSSGIGTATISNSSSSSSLGSSNSQAYPQQLQQGFQPTAMQPITQSTSSSSSGSSSIEQQQQQQQQQLLNNIVFTADEAMALAAGLPVLHFKDLAHH